MVEPKAKTSIERFGFNDPDLTTPAYDEIMCWLDSDIEAVLSKVLIEMSRAGDKWAIYRWGHEDKPRNGGEKCGTASFPRMSISGWKVTEKIWEHPITAGDAFIVGFVDLYVIASPVLVGPNGNETVPCRDCDGGIWQPAFPESVFRFSLKVKPKIPSLGEVIRQVRVYETYLNPRLHHVSVVVSPDSRFFKQLRGQNIYGIEYPKPN